MNPALAASYEQPLLFKLAQTDSSDTVPRSNLKVGSRGEDVRLVQTQLKKLGYYDGITDGQFGKTTSDAVIKFQQDKNLLADGIVGSQTRELIKAEILKQNNFTATPTPEPVAESSSDEEKSSSSNWMQLGLIGLGILAGGGILFFLIRWVRNSRTIDDDTEFVQPPPDRLPNSNQAEYLEDTNIIKPPLHQLESPEENKQDSSNNTIKDISPAAKTIPKLLPAQNTSHLAKVNIVDELIQDLVSANPSQKRKAIWELGQKGDSRAIQPLVEQMVEADSQQRSLILAALAEIGTRTLKPMNRALAVSMQDESPDVRKNAIRDLTRVYDMMAQISQMLSMATEDEDPEVQETAKYAISQMNRIRTLPSEEPETKIQYPEEWEENS